MKEFVDLYSLINLIKATTDFNGRRSGIDSLMTNQKYWFRNTKHK